TDQVRWHPGKPAPKGCKLAALEQAPTAYLYQARHLVMVPGFERVTDRRFSEPIFCEPARGLAVQLSDIQSCLAQTLAQDISEQPVVAEPASFFVKRDQKQVRAFEMVEHRLTVALTRHCIAQRSGQALQNRRPKQECLDLRRLLLEDLLDQVV